MVGTTSGESPGYGLRLQKRMGPSLEDASPPPIRCTVASLSQEHFSYGIRQFLVVA